MAGEISYVEGFEKRMNLLHPTIYQMNSFLRNWNPTLTSGVKEFISHLQNSRKLVYLVSGGISHVWLYSVSQLARISGEWQAGNSPRTCFVQWNLLFEWFVQWLWSLSAHKLSQRQMPWNREDSSPNWKERQRDDRWRSHRSGNKGRGRRLYLFHRCKRPSFRFKSGRFSDCLLPGSIASPPFSFFLTNTRI